MAPKVESKPWGNFLEELETRKIASKCTVDKHACFLASLRSLSIDLHQIFRDLICRLAGRRNRTAEAVNPMSY